MRHFDQESLLSAKTVPTLYASINHVIFYRYSLGARVNLQTFLTRTMHSSQKRPANPSCTYAYNPTLHRASCQLSWQTVECQAQIL